MSNKILKLINKSIALLLIIELILPTPAYSARTVATARSEMRRNLLLDLAKLSIVHRPQSIEKNRKSVTRNPSLETVDHGLLTVDTSFRSELRALLPDTTITTSTSWYDPKTEGIFTITSYTPGDKTVRQLIAQYASNIERSNLDADDPVEKLLGFSAKIITASAPFVAFRSPLTDAQLDAKVFGKALQLIYPYPLKRSEVRSATPLAISQDIPALIKVKKKRSEVRDGFAGVRVTESSGKSRPVNPSTRSPADRLAQELAEVTRTLQSGAWTPEFAAREGELIGELNQLVHSPPSIDPRQNEQAVNRGLSTMDYGQSFVLPRLGPKTQLEMAKFAGVSLAKETFIFSGAELLQDPKDWTGLSVVAALAPAVILVSNQAAYDAVMGFNQRLKGNNSPYLLGAAWTISEAKKQLNLMLAGQADFSDKIPTALILNPASESAIKLEADLLKEEVVVRALTPHQFLSMGAAAGVPSISTQAFLDNLSRSESVLHSA